VAVDLVWGYLGILSLGHGAFFALGGYAMGMYLMRQIGDRGVYGDPVLPDFMVFLNWQELPWFWHGFDMFWFAHADGGAGAGALAFVFGWLAFRSRVTGVYLSIITQAMTYALMLAFFRNEMGFGGNNGLTDFKDILGFDLQADSTRIGLFLASALALALGYLACRWIVTSRLGRVAVAIRDAESGTRFIGYRVEPGQARHLDLLGHARRARRRALRAAGRHHQSGRVLAAQLHRAGGLGGRRRARDTLRRGHRRRRGQLRQDLSSPAPSRRPGCSPSAVCSCW
jgi:urea ABC transporter permease protein UrtC